MQTATSAFFKARQGYKKASEVWVKNLLEEIFSKDDLTGDIIELVTSFEDACRLTGENPNDAKYTTGTAASIAYNRCATICLALCDGEVLSYENKQQQKHYCIHEYVLGVGFRFRYADCDDAVAFAPGGLALCLPDNRRALYFYKNFVHELTPFYHGK